MVISDADRAEPGSVALLGMGFAALGGGRNMFSRRSVGGLLIAVPVFLRESLRPQRRVDLGHDRLAEAVQQYENGRPIRTRGARLGKQRHEWNTRLGCAVIHLRYFFAGDGGASSLSMRSEEHTSELQS